jgi:hypothetical protein
MIKLLIHSPTKHDSTSFYRSWGVMHNLNRIMGRELDLIDFTSQRSWTWADLGGIDILFIQRPYSPDMLKLAQYVKNLGIKVWVDYDDNLFQLPNESRSFFNFTPQVKQIMIQTLQCADVISVSTQPLHDFFNQQLGLKNICVVPNALNDDLFTRTPSFNHDSNAVVWRGSETHVADLVYFTPEILQAMAATPYKWHFMGFNPFTITNLVDEYRLTEKIAVHEPQDVIIYHQQLVAMKPKLMHVPLVQNALNECKSNIAWIEATYAGAVTIAPDWTEWKRPGMITYKDQSEYQAHLVQPHDYAAMWQSSWDYIKQNLLLSHVNQQRAAIIKDLLQL